MKNIIFLIILFLLLGCTHILFLSSNTNIYPGIYEMENKGTIFDSIYHERIICHFKEDGTYLCQKFTKDILDGQDTGSYRLNGDCLERTAHDDVFQIRGNGDQYYIFVKTKCEKVRNITKDSFELYMLAISENYWQKYTRLSEKEYTELIDFTISNKSVNRSGVIDALH